MHNDAIHILISSDDKYAPYGATLVQSIIHTTQHPVKIYWGGVALSENIKNDIKSLESKNVTITIIDINQDDFKGYPVSERLPLASYVRLKAKDLLPHLDKVLYLDCDILVKSDLFDLWNIDISNYFVAGVPDRNSEDCRKFLSLDNKFYINAGVLLMNLDLMRKKNVDVLFTETLNKYIDKIRFADQDIINISLGKQILYLDRKYNSHRKREYTDKIVHFVWDKPWEFLNQKSCNKIYRFKYLHEFWKYYLMTPWAKNWNEYKKLYYKYLLKQFCYRFFYKDLKETRYQIFGLTFCKIIHSTKKVSFSFLGIPLYRKKIKRS